MLGAQYATIIVDTIHLDHSSGPFIWTIHLVAANTSKENIYAWMEADAYLEPLADRYETISAPFLSPQQRCLPLPVTFFRLSAADLNSDNWLA